MGSFVVIPKDAEMAWWHWQVLNSVMWWMKLCGTVCFRCPACCFISMKKGAIHFRKGGNQRLGGGDEVSTRKRGASWMFSWVTLRRKEALGAKRSWGPTTHKVEAVKFREAEIPEKGLWLVYNVGESFRHGALKFLEKYSLESNNGMKQELSSYKLGNGSANMKRLVILLLFFCSCTDDRFEIGECCCSRGARKCCWSETRCKGGVERWAGLW